MALVLAFGVAGIGWAQRPPPSTVAPSAASAGTYAVSVDPCALATVEELRLAFAAALGRVTDAKFEGDGERITLSNAQLRLVTCPGFRGDASFDLAYTQSRDPGRGERHGVARFGMPLTATIVYTAEVAAAPVRASNLKSARACVTDVNPPAITTAAGAGWADSARVRQWLAAEFRSRLCFDVTSLVFVYLSSGKALPRSR